MGWRGATSITVALTLAAGFSTGKAVEAPAPILEGRIFGSVDTGAGNDVSRRHHSLSPGSRRQSPGPDRPIHPKDSKQNEVSVAVDPRDPNRVLAVFHNSALVENTLLGPIGYANPRVVAYLSVDGGISFRRTFKFKPRPGSPFTADPSVAFAKDGTAYVAYLAGSRMRDGAWQGGGLFVARSRDGGRSWAEPVLAVPGYADGACQSPDKPFIGVGRRPADAKDGTSREWIYVSWQEHHLDGGDCRQGLTTVEITRSSDGGRSFSPAKIIAPGEEMAFGSMPRVDAAGNVFVSYLRNGSGDSCGAGALDLLVARSSNGGRSFTKEVVARSCFAHGFGNGARGIANSIPTLDVSGNDSAVAWVAGAGESDDDIEVRVLDEPGDEWRALPTLATGAESAALLSWIGHGPDGRLHAMYTASQPGGVTDTYLASTDDRRTGWASVEKVSSASSINNGGYSGFGFGHYQALAIGGDGRAHILWMDRREIDHERAADPTGRMLHIWVRSLKV